MVGIVSKNAYAKRALFEPPDGKVLLIVGQDQEAIASYLDAAKVLPAGFTSYTSLRRLEGLTEPFNQGDGTQHLQKLSQDYPEVALQIGLYLVDQCADMAEGKLDDRMDRLGEWMRARRQPIFLRIGYEFDGPHNHYPPEDYVRAYRRMVDRLRKAGVRNVAYVWHSYASKISRPLEDWYPGDDYVDWVGTTYFDQPQSFMMPVVQFAKARHKPLMIAESCPIKFQTRHANSWNLWFKPYLKFVQAHGIKAICYISCDWDSLAQFKHEKWGDTRMQAHPEILRLWLEETAQDRYLKASPDLYRQIGYRPAKD